MSLTDVAIRDLKGAGKLQNISDGEGLQLWKMPVGSKLWRYAYRYDGAQKTLAVGQYPAIGLAEARKRRAEAKALLTSGSIDPARQKQRRKASKAISEANTFALIARCLIPDFDGAIFSAEWKEALWARFYTGAPPRQRRSVERYNIVKRA